MEKLELLENTMNSLLHHIQNWPERGRQANWCAATLAKNCGVSLRTLERFCLKEMGKSPKAWLSEQRQQQAAKLLHDGCSVKETAGNLDYKHSTHLSRDYKGHWGCCPTEK
jgi:AraC-like DNA-binding protein